MDYKSLSHTRWECKYHIVFIPKYRKQKLYKEIRKTLGECFHKLAQQKEKSAIYIAREYEERNRYFTGQQMWARGYFVLTVGLDEEVIRKYIQDQKSEDRKLDDSALEDGAIDTTWSVVRLGGVEHHVNVENPAGRFILRKKKFIFGILNLLILFFLTNTLKK